jgi:hypothetical protein
MPSQPFTDLVQPSIELFRVAAVGSRKSSDYPSLACRRDQRDTGYEKHRCCDEGKAQPSAKAPECSVNQPDAPFEVDSTMC